MTRPTHSKRLAIREQQRARRATWRSRQPKADTFECVICHAVKARASCVWGNGSTKGDVPTCSQACAESYHHQNLREVRIVGDLAYVPLTKGAEAVIDAADAPMARQYRWHLGGNKYRKYAVRTGIDEMGMPYQVSMHRDLMGSPDGTIRHRDGDGLNNRRANMLVRERQRKAGAA